MGLLDELLLGKPKRRRRKKRSHPLRDFRRWNTKRKVQRANWLGEKNRLRTKADSAAGKSRREKATARRQKQLRAERRRKRLVEARQRQALRQRGVSGFQPAQPLRPASPAASPRAKALSARIAPQRAAGTCGQRTGDGTPCQRLGQCPPGFHNAPGPKRSRRGTQQPGWPAGTSSWASTTGGKRQP